MTTLSMDSTVGQWVAEHPQTADVFEELQLDYCCGGCVTLAKACEGKQLDVNAVIEQLTRAIATSDEQTEGSWKESTLGELCEHIQQTHHAYLREELPRLTELINKVVLAHADKHPELIELQQVISGLRAELEPHMFKEEQILFPAIRQMEQAAGRPSFPFGTIANPIRMMEHEHDAAGDALSEMRRLTNDFVPSHDACNSYRALFDALQVLERDMHQHIHKENNILFPGAAQLEASLGATAQLDS